MGLGFGPCAFKIEAANNQEVPVENFFKPPPKQAVATIKSATWQTIPEPRRARGDSVAFFAVVPNLISLGEDQYQGKWRILCDSGGCKHVVWRSRGLPHACD